MWRNIVLILFLGSFVFSNDANAQDQRFKAGIILGTNFSQIDGDNSAGYIKLGLSGGLRGVVVLTDKMELSLELLYDQRGSRSQSNFDELFFPFKVINNYVSVPVVFNYQDWLDQSEEYYKLHFHAGFAYNRLLDSTVDDEDPNSSFVQVAQDFNRNDVSFLIGATFYTGPHLAITGRWNRSLIPLYKNGDGPVLVRQAFISKHLSLQLLYMF